MKIIKRICLTILVIVAIGILFRGWFYRHLVTYKSTGQRQTFTAIDKKLIENIGSNKIENQNIEIKDIVKLGLNKTAKQLNFTTCKNEIDPNKLINTKTANCVGYASYFATACNFILKENNLDKVWKAKPQIGQLYILGKNVHEYFNSSFFKDHDFVTIENKNAGEILAVDPTVNDYFDIEFITIRK